nr:MASE3 domain-containing protein [uncultured Methanoregula sp.]
MLSDTCRTFRNPAYLQYLIAIAISIILLLLLLVLIKTNLLLVIIVELVSIAVAFSIFLLTWNSRRNAQDSFLMALGISFLFTAVFDTLFTFSLMNTQVLQEFSFNNIIQIWIAARYFQAITLLVATALIGRTLTKKASIDAAILVPVYTAITALLFMSILVWKNFPVCDIHGYTPFKIASEYIISTILILTGIILVRKRKLLDPDVWFFLFIALFLFIMGELAFAISGSGFTDTNFLGFCLRGVAIYFIYRAIVVVGISRPLDLLFHELKERDLALRKSEEQYRNVVEDQTELISRFLPDGTYVFVNEAYCRFFGMSREEIMGQKMLQLVYPDDQGTVRDSLASLTRESPLVTVPNRILLPNGSIRWIRWTDRAIFNAAGTITEYQSVGRDITLLRLSEDALSLAHKKLALLTSITRHDILNQLTALKAYVELLRQDAREYDSHGYLEKVQAIADVIEEQIAFMKDYEMMGVSAPAWQDVAATIGRSVSALPTRNVSVDIDVGNVEIFADPLLEKVFYNLVDNALRYGGEKLTRIRIYTQESPNELALICEDNGNGVSSEDKVHLFEKGFGHHTGLGLFLIREILLITGISITENGVPEKCARFVIQVPKGAFRYSGRPE